MKLVLGLVALVLQGTAGRLSSDAASNKHVQGVDGEDEKHRYVVDSPRESVHVNRSTFEGVEDPQWSDSVLLLLQFRSRNCLR
jgi:hypothetical protein